MDIESLLRLLKENKVKFVIIGAAAFPVHGYSRATLDTDIFIEPHRTNAKRCLNALKEFGYDTSDISVDDLLTKKLLVRQYLVEIDIHPFVAGVQFDEVWKNKVKDKIGRTEVYFASLDDLIKMKRATKRKKDKEDLRILLELKKRKKLQEKKNNF
ncbi:MAG: nucleotidyltransferase [candidate division WOR-3 bacterium]|nr:nucleotidyltransferase [candidate division WOR-3 bacterium]